MPNAITLPQLQVNGVNIVVVPNSLELITGRGTAKIKAQSSGGGSVQPVYFEDATAKVGNLKFKIFPTQENIEALLAIKDNSNNNTALVTENGFTQTMPDAAIINDPPLMLGVDGEIDIEMEGGQVV